MAKSLRKVSLEEMEELETSDQASLTIALLRKISTIHSTHSITLDNVTFLTDGRHSASDIYIFTYYHCSF